MSSSKGANDLLAPVPLIHLVSAISDGLTVEVTFGSEKDVFFKDLGPDIPIGMRVWIYASKTGSETLDKSKLQRVCYVGEFGGSTEAGADFDTLIKNRPSTAKVGDTPWSVLWAVRSLRPFEPVRFYRDFRSASSGKPLASEPRGPMLVRSPVD